MGACKFKKVQSTHYHAHVHIPSLGCMSVTKSQSVRIAKGELHCCDFTIEGNQVTAARYVVRDSSKGLSLFSYTPARLGNLVP